MQSPQQGGASVHASGRIPATDLATLVSLLAESYKPSAAFDKSDLKTWPALQFFPGAGNRLKLDTISVIMRLVKSGKLKAFDHTPTSGFLRDFKLPDPGTSIKMGGHLLDGSSGAVSKAVAELKALIGADLDSQKISVSNLLIQNPKSAMESLARETGAKSFSAEMPASMVQMEFAKQDRPANARDKDVARLLSAEERVQADDWLERLAETIVEVQSARDDDFDDIRRDKLFATLRQEADLPGSQVSRFLNFLEDEALARVRLAVTFAIMRGLSAQIATSERPAERIFCDYVARATDLFELFGAPESETALHVSLSRDYGTAADFSLSDELVKALFYKCLPVWPESNVQLFEARATDPVSRGQSAVRDVSYRFRVNGADPQANGLRSFEARIERLKDVLLSGHVTHIKAHRIRKAVAETVFLWLVLNPGISGTNLAAEANKLADELGAGGRALIEKLLKDLNGWSGRVVSVQQSLVGLLKNRSRNAIAHAQRNVGDLYVVVQQSIVDWVAIERSRGKPREPLVRGAESVSEKAEWFRHLKVGRQPDSVVAPLFSVRVQTTLHERSLAASDEEEIALRAVRELPDGMLNVTWSPVRTTRDPNTGDWSYSSRAGDLRKLAVWRMGPGVDIGYDPELFKQRPEKATETGHQYRAAAIAAAAVLVYVVLQVIVDRLTKELEARFPTLMVRLQEQGKEAASTEGDHLIYAAAQAVEGALMRDTAVRMQGLVTSTGVARFKEPGAAHALSSAFPLVLGTGQLPAVPKVAVVVYATRPCDESPGHEDADGFIFQAKTYLADAVSAPFNGYRLQFDRMQSHVVASRDAFASPKLIVEEVSRLHSLGYEHVMLISNHYGNRRINRTAQRHSPHTQTGFLDEIATKFSGVSVYMLRRDVFPATRLRKRAKEESAFEAPKLASHYEFQLSSGDRNVIKALVPAYTFATLSIVGTDDGSRPQSGFCTYFLDKDYQVRNTEWQVRVDGNLLGSSPVRDSLIAVLRGLHFLEGEKQPVGGLLNPVLDPFGWVQPSSAGGAGEVEVFPGSRRRGSVVLSLPALLSHVTDVLHRGQG